jgi:acyl carrier protein
MAALSQNPSVEEVLGYLVSVLGRILDRSPADIGPSATLDEDLALESVAFVELQVWLEDELGVEIDPITVVELNTLGDVAVYLHSLILARQ